MFNITFYEDEISADSCPLKTGECDLTTLIDGCSLFYECSNMTYFVEDLPSLKNGYYMFYGCSGLDELNWTNLSSLENGSWMFAECTNLSSLGRYITGFNFNSLTNGDSMFDSCTKLDSFDFDLPNLKYAPFMFRATKIRSFDGDLSSLEESSFMFSDDTSLTTFSGDLTSLLMADGMFAGCTSLTSFTGDLSSLSEGGAMFSKCKLDPSSVMIIAESLSKRIGSSRITIGIGVSATEVDGKNTEAQLEEFAINAGYSSWADLKQRFVDKGWTATFQYGGTNNGITLSEDDQTVSIPIYARLIEVTPAGETYTDREKARAEYCTEDGTKYYNIDWGHDITSPEHYQQFGSLLEACGYFGVIPKKYLEEA